MKVLNEAMEIMETIGYKEVYAIYKSTLNKIVNIRGSNKDYECIELKRNLSNIKPIIINILEIDLEKPIKYPLNKPSEKYLEFSLKNKSIIPYNLGRNELSKIKQDIGYLLEEYHWLIKD